MADQLYRHIVYPVYLVEEKKQEYTVADTVYRQTGYVTFSRVPAKRKFVKGQLFVSAGIRYDYEGECGWPRFSGRTKALADALLVPTLISKMLEVFVYFGPDLKSATPLDLEEFKSQIVVTVKRFSRKDIPQLKRVIGDKKDFESVILGLDWWRYHGGRRDEDGHPLED